MGKEQPKRTAARKAVSITGIERMSSSADRLSSDTIGSGAPGRCLWRLDRPLLKCSVSFGYYPVDQCLILKEVSICFVF
jgi:hypothetical protein